MCIGRSRILTTIIMLLVFAGQSVAAVSPSCAGSRGHASVTAQHDHHHAAHQRADVAAKTVPCDCCHQHDCSMVQCVSAPAAVASIPAAGPTLSGSVLIHEYPASYAALNRAAPYRPPIFC